MLLIKGKWGICQGNTKGWFSHQWRNDRNLAWITTGQFVHCILFQLQLQLISPVEVYEGGGKSVMVVCKRPNRAMRCILWLWKIVQKMFSLWFIHILKIAFTAVKGMKSPKLGMLKGCCLVIKRIRKGYLFCP